jgi:hypothetical protein
MPSSNKLRCHPPDELVRSELVVVQVLDVLSSLVGMVLLEVMLEVLVSEVLVCGSSVVKMRRSVVKAMLSHEYAMPALVSSVRLGWV